MFDKKTYREQNKNLKYLLTLDNEMPLEVNLN